MFSNSVPQFYKGRILKREMLESIRDYPRTLLDIYSQYDADGVLTGAEVTIGESDLTIAKGIVKHNGIVYVLDQAYQLPYKATGKETLLKIRFEEPEMIGDFVSHRSVVVLHEDTNLQPNELELGRFKLKAGARLRSDYQSFADLATEYNTFNVIHVRYAAYESSTVHPMIIRCFATELLKSGTSHVYDVSFAMQALNDGIVPRELLLHYIAQRIGGGYRPYTNVQIHKHLTRILDEARSGRRASGDIMRGGMQRIMVD
ncbi:DNA and RNA helicase [Paenibacillus arenosi]|uniref:DNA and RNA helicase n=1 Tax=Paenibacillus arenosi TaxID=2774142 RepID=A0ABR9B0T9_9BACL|nr:DNA and RNA helicase [Paenibacillus arenosi]MBD8498801.1 DNA and RNA helicase [Paenibacillus arenosi]